MWLPSPQNDGHFNRFVGRVILAGQSRLVGHENRRHYLADSGYHWWSFQNVLSGQMQMLWYGRREEIGLFKVFASNVII